jgi:hypothetical protein
MINNIRIHNHARPNQDRSDENRKVGHADGLPRGSLARAPPESPLRKPWPKPLASERSTDQDSSTRKGRGTKIPHESGPSMFHSRRTGLDLVRSSEIGDHTLGQVY